MISLVIAVVVVALLIMFSIQNAAPVAISFFIWEFRASLALTVFLSVLVGLLAGGIIAFTAVKKWRRRGSAG